MGSKLYNVFTCDRCREEIALEITSDKLKSIPSGWEKVTINYKGILRHPILCPRCYAIFKNVIATNEKRFVDKGFIKVESEVPE